MLNSATNARIERSRAFCSSTGLPLPAAEIARRLQQAGFVVRPLTSYGLPDHLRITIGKPDQNRAFVAALETVLRQSPDPGSDNHSGRRPQGDPQ